MLAIDMDEARPPAAELGQQLLGLHGAAVGLPGDAPVRGHAVFETVRLEAIDHLRVGPIEQIDPERRLAVGEGMGKRDEEAAFERAHFHDRAGDS